MLYRFSEREGLVHLSSPNFTCKIKWIFIYCLVSTLKFNQISCEVLPVGTVLRGCVCHSISKGPCFANTRVCVCLCSHACGCSRMS